MIASPLKLILFCCAPSNLYGVSDSTSIGGEKLANAGKLLARENEYSIPKRTSKFKKAKFFPAEK